MLRTRSFTLPVLLASALIVLAACGASLEGDLNALKAKGASRDEVQEKLGAAHEMGPGQLMRGEDAKTSIQNFCNEPVKGAALLESHQEMVFFSSPKATVFAFFDPSGKLVDALTGLP